ncbi:MAG: YdeI/OmpD-associated family protein [bacterium]|nr:YdeI/OmpD-associated family protein [bacterium]
MSAPEPQPLRIRTEIVPAGPAAAIELTEDQLEELGAGARSAVVVTIEGHSERLRIARMGGCLMIGLRREVREAFGVEAGSVVDAEIALDAAPREVEIPAELEREFAAAPEVASSFEELAYTHRKEFARWVGEAKREETRLRRAAEAVVMLREGRTRS